ncbi:MAG TPA: alanine--tRNA ligase [Gemmataceae bacterium]|nr:alanine--tRNA ligase [Gemmataceae bacterium]
MPTANEIRQQFIDFFVKKHGHTFVPSSPVVPQDDPTLLFTNAGMNQFKPYFLGTEKPAWKRVANTQKCIRAGGKHNDLDDVGKDTYHHTFFEMLGNWSFGDYFKKEAIAWAWELLTDVWKLDKSRLHVTVFEGSPDEGVPRDDEAFNYWKSETDIDPSHIHLGNKKDNFWEMGDTGPCGPCSEIHIDRTPDKSGGKLVNAGTPDVIEIWNLVFIQFNRDPDKKLTPLPAKNVDTGMGFERVTAVLQGKSSNYDTDVFAPIFAAIQKITGAKPYTGKLEDLKDTAYRVIGDHIRTLTFALTDGATPGNEGRNYVLRRILRRAERYGRQHFGTSKPFLCDLVPSVVEAMGAAFPELRRDPTQVANLIREDEESFIRTLDRGIHLFQDAAQRAKTTKTISGKDAFQLHDTYGLYIDITEQMAAEAGLGVDRTGYEREMEQAKDKARGARKKIVITSVRGELPRTDDSAKQNFVHHGKLLGWVSDTEVIRTGRLETGEEASLLLDRSCFYAEQGGQVGDTGLIGSVVGDRTGTGTFAVEDTQKLGETVLHIGRVLNGWLEPGQVVIQEVSDTRFDTMRNHTATHLMNWALRKVLAGTIDQKGSLVDPDKTRFDFTHDKALSPEEITEIERLVNERVYTDLPVTAKIMPLAEAKKIPGVRAVFGEKYPDPVRVLLIGVEKPEDATENNSVEFCGGTHLTHTGQIGFFKIISQEPVSKGVRRVTAITGREAVAYFQRQAAVMDELTSRFNCKPEELPDRVAALQDEIKKLQQQLKKGAATDLQGAADKLLAAAPEVNGAKLIIGEMPAGPAEVMLQQVDRLRQKATSSVAVLGWTDDGKVGLIAAVTEDLVKKGLHAGKLIGQVAKVVGGGGGGKPTMAQAGGKEPAKLGEALQLARTVVEEQLKG